uniref:Family with sequence similarity 13 member B n=1 Tax=Cyclopterus lumpus TaxID=8103 RepID=A0A8C2X7Z3_CYCLU
MRKSVSPLPGNEGGSSASTTRVFGVPLEEVTRTHTISGHEVPALVKHIVDYIEEHGLLDLEGLFLVNGNAERVDWLRQRYDSGEEVELEKEADLASAVSLLRLFLQELPEPVIPTAIQGHILQLHQDYSNEEELCRNLKYLLQQLPQLNYGLLRFLCRFLASVASLQQESWNIGTLAAVFGPDIFHLSTEGEDLRDQESVSRVLAELLDNQEGLFDSEEDDVSTTNDYSSINEQITELLDDEKCEAECEELPQDGEEGPVSSDSPQHTPTDDNPVPAFKPWQDDSESGEAQLSPLAGRMEASLSSSPSFGSKEAMRGGDSVTHQLTKKLQHLKKKIKQFEEQFEKERNYKPSHGDKAANPKVLKWMTDLTKIRRQIKDAKHRAESELGPLTRPRSNTLPKSFGSTLDQGAHDAAGEMKGQGPTREETLELIQHRVKGKKQEDGWPDDIKKMTKEQLSCEKTVLQKNLLHYEGLHGRPVTREERLVVKPLYDRYRLVKQMLTRVSITPITVRVSPSSKRRSQTLQPIIEGETAHFWEEIKEEEEQEEEERKEREGEGEEENKSREEEEPELLEQLWKARAEKKKMRKTIREFEEDFYQHNGRNVQKEDRVPMLEEYREYKRIKAKLRLLEVLISKQDSSKSI